MGAARAAFFAACFGVGVFHRQIAREVLFGPRVAAWRYPDGTVSRRVANASEISFAGPAGRLGASRARPPRDDPACLGPPRFLVYLPGAYVSRRAPGVARRADALRAPPFCFEVTALDYRGFGESAGAPATVGDVAADARVVFASLRERAPAGVGEVVVYGAGRLGAAAALALAADLCRRPDPRAAPPTAVVLEDAWAAAAPAACAAPVFRFYGEAWPFFRRLLARPRGRAADAVVAARGRGDAAFAAAAAALDRFLAARRPRAHGSCPGEVYGSPR